MMRARLAQLRAEWLRSRRLRLGALVVLVFLGLHLIFALSDDRALRMESYERDAELLAKLEEAGKESAWPARADEAEQALAALRQTVPEVASAGLAQAELQAWLAGRAAQAGLQETRVQAENTLEVPGRPELWQVVARLDGVFTAAGVPRLLQLLDQGLPWIQVERMELSDGRQVRVSLVARAYYRKPAAEEPTP